MRCMSAASKALRSACCAASKAAKHAAQRVTHGIPEVLTTVYGVYTAQRVTHVSRYHLASLMRSTSAASKAASNACQQVSPRVADARRLVSHGAHLAHACLRLLLLLLLQLPRARIVGAQWRGSSSRLHATFYSRGLFRAQHAAHLFPHIARGLSVCLCSAQHPSASVSIRQHIIRQHTSAFVRIPLLRGVSLFICAYVRIRQHTSAYVRIPLLRGVSHFISCMLSRSACCKRKWSGDR